MNKLIEVNGKFKFGNISNSHDMLPKGVYMLKFDELSIYNDLKTKYQVLKETYTEFGLDVTVYMDPEQIKPYRRYLKST